MNATKSDVRTLPFWLMFFASFLGVVTSSAATPNIPLFVNDVLAGGPEMSGLLIALADISALFAMPFCGVLADRFGYRVVAAAGASASAFGFALITLFPLAAVAVGSRLLVGMGIATAVTLSLTVLVTITRPSQRGRALSLYGLSVWIGIAVGPQIATFVYSVAGSRMVFAICVVLELSVAILFVLLPRTLKLNPEPRSTARERTGIRVAWGAFRAVWVPGTAALVAWCAEGLMLSFLIVHLVASGLPASGILGAASIFSVFAVSVIITRILLADMPDRIGPISSVAISLIVLSVGLVLFAAATNFTVAAAGAVLVGIGFSPLYPSLTMLATQRLLPSNRALGLGLFGSFTSVGFASGGLLGGLVLSITWSGWAFLVAAGLQIVGLVLVVVFTPRESSLAHSDPDLPAVPPR